MAERKTVTILMGGGDAAEYTINMGDYEHLPSLNLASDLVVEDYHVGNNKPLKTHPDHTVEVRWPNGETYTVDCRQFGWAEGTIL